ncbi:MAG: NAD(P)/FAD-dependent oxidoreductase [Candidatus Kapabacteria bacterium]|nr:NAD(P)/FAD-dependent oxidoreductase [Candidatus Kapabacteria bacterium]
MQLSKPRVIIVGAGFGGLKAAKSLKNAKVDVILIDKTNHHLFQPLLYQVATSALSPGDIAIPIRTILRKNKNVHILMDEVLDVKLDERKVILNDGELNYDYLILAPGARHSYFGNSQWERIAPGLKSLKDALHIRETILSSFEKAERFYSTSDRDKYLNFVIIGGGPTGVELAGAIAEIGKKTMLPDFPILKSDDINVFLIEANDRLLKSYSEDLSEYTLEALQRIGVKVLLKTKVTNITDDGVEIGKDFIETTNIFWAAGNESSSLNYRLGVPLDNIGRVIVEKDMSIPGYPDVFVIGDAAYYIDDKGNQLPGIAPVAIQQAEYVSKIIKKRLSKNKRPPFKYFDKGSMATIGRAKAVANFGKIKFKGLIAWLLWTTVHIFFLINFRNRLRVLFEWFWYYLTNQPGARIIVYNDGKKITSKAKEPETQETLNI